MSRRDEDEPSGHLPRNRAAGDGGTGRAGAAARATGERRAASALMTTGTKATATGYGLATAPTASPSAATGTETTAEIPVVRASGTKSRPPVELEDGTLWYPGVSKRLPAPFGLRLAVWLLFFLLLVGLAGLAVEHYHPDWLSILRKTGPGTVATRAVRNGGGGQTGTTAATPAAGGGGLQLVRTGSSSTTYAVSARSYSIVIRFDHACWTRIASPAGSSHYLLQRTLQASESPKTVRVRGSSSVYLGAATKRITIVSAGHTLGVVQTPRVGQNYDFVPAGH